MLFFISATRTLFWGLSARNTILAKIQICLYNRTSSPLQFCHRKLLPGPWGWARATRPISLLIGSSRLQMKSQNDNIRRCFFGQAPCTIIGNIMLTFDSLLLLPYRTKPRGRNKTRNVFDNPKKRRVIIFFRTLFTIERQ